MQPYASTLFEIVDGGFVYEGLDGGVNTKKEPVLGVEDDETGVILHLDDGEPKLHVPEGQRAELLRLDHVLKDGQRVEGEFVEVRIY